MAVGRRYRILLESVDTQEVRKVEFRGPRLNLILALATVLVALVVYVLWSGGQALHQEAAYRAEVDRLQELNQAQEFHIQRFADRLGHLNRQMERLEDFHAKLKILANLDLQEHKDAAMAAGGPRSDTPEMSRYLEKNLQNQIQRIQWELEELQLNAAVQEQNAYRVERFFESQRSLLAATPAVWPVRGWITSGFGRRLSPFTNTMRMHEGIDICARQGTPVKATADGVVIYAGWKTDYGKMVTLDHGYGYRTRYGHLSKIYVRNGQHVDRGEIVGAVGTTGRSTGPHLHYEVKVNGVPENPKKYILD